MADIDFLVPGGALSGVLAKRLLSGDPASAEPPIPLAARVGAFRLIDTLGSGGSGWVYRAERVDGGFDQAVALKVLRAGTVSSATMERERKVLASLRHPNIAMILDGGTTADGLPWFAMELVEGERIDRWFASQQPDWRAALKLLRQVTDAVGFAHRHLVVHRDIKPANVLVGSDGRPRLVDFGIADSEQIEGGDDQGRYALTPEYASPEQRSGEAMTSASDVFQLGRVIEELLFTGEHRPGMPRRVRRALEAVILRATRVDPRQRYGFGDGLTSEIDRILDGYPPQAQQAGLLLQTGLFVRRHAALAIVSLLALALLLTASLHWTRRVAQERDIARAEAIQARISNDIFAYIHGGQPRAQQVSDLTDLLERAMTRYEGSPRQQLIAVAAAARLLLDLRQPAQALALLQQHVPSDAADWPLEWTAALAIQAAAQRQLRDHAASHASLDQADALLARGASTPSLRAQVRLERVDLLRHSLEDLERAEALQAQALAELAHADELDTRTLIRLLSWQVEVAGMESRHEQSLATQRQVTRLSEGLHGVDSWAAWEQQRRLAAALLRPRNPAAYDEARAILSRQRTALGEIDAGNRAEHSSLLDMEGYLAGIEERWDEALAKRSELIALLREDRPGSFALATQAEAYAITLRDAEGGPLAMAAFRQSIEDHTAVLGPEHPLVWVQQMELATLMCNNDQVAEAGELFTRIRDKSRSSTQSMARDVVIMDLYWVQCLLVQKRTDEARQLFVPTAAALAAREHPLNRPDTNMFQRMKAVFGEPASAPSSN